MTGTKNSTPDPRRTKPGPDPAQPDTRWNSGVGDRPQISRFDRIDKQVRTLTWLVAINMVLSAAFLVVALFVLGEVHG